MANEQIPANAAVAPPAPRGHRTKARNLYGATLYRRLKVSALARGVTFQPLARATRLVVDDGRVVGIEYEAPPPHRLPGCWHERLSAVAARLSIYYPPVGRRLAGALEPRRVTTQSVTVRGGAVLATGGFAFDRELIAEVAPAWSQANVTPLGTIGEDGAAIRLTAELGVARGCLDRMSGWRFIYPPSAFTKGVVVGPGGERIGNEQLYGATLARSIVEKHAGRAFLVCDARIWREARRRPLGRPGCCSPARRCGSSARADAAPRRSRSSRASAGSFRQRSPSRSPITTRA